jgi:anti-anti-sigma factor
MKEPIQVATRHSRDIGILEMRGDVTSAAEKAVESAYKSLVSEKVGKILLDFSKVEYINSAGLAIVIGLLSDCRKQGYVLKACCLTSHFQKIFDMVGITKYVPHYESVDAALQSFSPK